MSFRKHFKFNNFDFSKFKPKLCTQQRHVSTSYDFVVIGGSSGGLAAAKEASSLGAKVALVDSPRFESKHLKWGINGSFIKGVSIPKKLMHHAALFKDAIHDAKWYGWQMDGPVNHNWLELRHAIENYIKLLNKDNEAKLSDINVEYINATASFKDSTTIQATTELGDFNLKAKYFLISVGSRAQYPDVYNATEYGITCDDIFNLEKPPGNTMIIGAGHSGLESAGFLNGLGYKTTVMVRSIPLRGFDQQMAGIVVNEMQSKGVVFLDRCIPKSIKKSTSGKLFVSWTNIANESFKEEFDTVVFAVGRRALTKELKVEKAGVRVTGDEGRIQTFNEQTNVPHIYAIGDVLYNKPSQTPVSVYSGKLLSRRLFGNSTLTMDYDNVPTTIFTPLEYGFIGSTEEEAMNLYGENNIEVYHSYYKPTEFFIPQRPINNCYLKVISLREGDQKVLGMHYIGTHSETILKGFSTAMKCNLTVKALMNTVGIHPTIAEEFTRINVTKRSGKNPKPASCCS
ncbi:thioredoxin reductase 1, mitochondrial-like [Sitophilus oryzae]|uniref:Thioredoxin reductase 1, mitochondrial-like n=1 Tax=Sitophilus oryzae TaxID=7048 RepID=A0A6J2YA20_SITOR|nr:thioredoxin reductase 1, mitochondrial-like [Sitophilus oryzae]